MLQTISVVFVIVLLLSFDNISARSEDASELSAMKRSPNFIRFGRNNRPNFIRFGKRDSRGPSFIRFGRSDATDPSDETSIKSLNKRPNFIRFGRSNTEAED